MNRPVQCTDDVVREGESVPTFQTGQEVHVSDLQTDAERFQAHGGSSQGASAPPPPCAGSSGDSITIEGKDGGRIIATNVLSSVKPGVTVQVGLQNRLIVNPGGGASIPHGGKAPRNISNKRPITNSTAEVEHPHMDIVSRRLAEDWRRLGRELHVEDATLDQIEIDNRVNGQYEINYQVIRKWKETCPSATVRHLALALATIGRGDLCDQLS